MAYGKEHSRLFWKSAFIAAVLATVAACTAHSSAGPLGSDDSDPSASGREIEDAAYRVHTEDPVVFLTIDDGATRDPEMIDVLDNAEIKATLFLTDQYVREDAGFFRRLRDETGAQIENHTLDHPDLTAVAPDEQRRQICDTSDNYEREFGRRPTLLRPPYGSFNDATLNAAARCGISHVVHWSAEIQDGEMQFAASDRLRAGDIVLMHFSEQFKEDIETFIAKARETGLEPALLTNYLD